MPEDVDLKYLVRSISRQTDQSLSDQAMAMNCVTENMGDEDMAVNCILKGLEESSERFATF